MTFDEVLATGRLRECLATGTGKGVKVGILDSGVASHLPQLGGRVLSNHEVVEDRHQGTRVVPLDQGVDVIEHGTACAYIIHRHAPDAELHSVRVIGQSHGATTGKLLAALEFAVEQDWQILNLSLGTEASYERIARLADRAYYRGQIWIAAKDNKRNKVGYPPGSPRSWGWTWISSKTRPPSATISSARPRSTPAASMSRPRPPTAAGSSSPGPASPVRRSQGWRRGCASISRI